MLMYNLYYKNEKLNALPVSKKELEEINKRKFVGKMNKESKEIVSIPTKDINIVKCYLV